MSRYSDHHRLATNVRQMLAKTNLPADAKIRAESEVRRDGPPAVIHVLDRHGRTAICRGPNCQRRVWWIKKPDGSGILYNDRAECHFLECPDAAAFDSKRKVRT